MLPTVRPSTQMVVCDLESSRPKIFESWGSFKPHLYAHTMLHLNLFQDLASTELCVISLMIFYKLASARAKAVIKLCGGRVRR